MSFASRKRILSFVHFSDIFSGLHFLCLIKIAVGVFSAIIKMGEDFGVIVAENFIDS